MYSPFAHYSSGKEVKKLSIVCSGDERSWQKPIIGLYCLCVVNTVGIFPLLWCNLTDTTWDKIKHNSDPGCAIECCCRDNFLFSICMSGGRAKITGDHSCTKEELRTLTYWLWREETNLCYLDAWRCFVNWAVGFYRTVDEYESHYLGSPKWWHKYLTFRVFFVLMNVWLILKGCLFCWFSLASKMFVWAVFHLF